MATPEHRARSARHGRRRGEERRRSRRRHGRDGQAISSSSSAFRRRHGEAERDARPRQRDDGLANVTVTPPPSPAKRPRVRSEVGLVRGCPWRFEPSNPHEGSAVDVQAADGVAMAAAPTSPVVAPADKCIGVVSAPEAAPAKGGASTASSSTSTVAPPATTTGVLYACQLSFPPPPPPLPFSQGARQDLVLTGAAPPLPMPAYAPCPKRMKPAIPSASRPAYVIPPIPHFPIIVQRQKDADELRRAALRERFAGLIAKSVEETAENYGKLLRSGKAPLEPELEPKPEPEPEPEPEPPKPVVEDEETLRQMAELDAARKRSREALAREERKARGAALFMQMAPPEHMRALGIDRAMESIVSPDRLRDGKGVPVLSPDHPCSPLEKLGYFLKAE